VARAQQVADAAIEVLAARGARGLTHRAVDAAAGLPPGTTSNYARTRAALLMVTLARIAELDAADGAGELMARRHPGGPPAADLADGLARMLHRMLTDPRARRRTLARFELAFEATRRAGLRAAYDDMGRSFRVQAARLLAAAGSAEPDRGAWMLVAWLEGTAFYALAGAGAASVPSQAELQAQLTRLLGALCSDEPGAPHSRS
jgi:DNA-binding transcriptional regulator YbjK